MATKYDVLTEFFSNISASSGQVNIGGEIPSGRRRFLTYIKIERNSMPTYGTTITGATVVVGSVAVSNGSAANISAGARLGLHLAGVGMSDNSGAVGAPEACFVNEIAGDVDHPIFSMAGPTTWMRVMFYSGAPTRLFARYYDEGE
jgi:hypothetical protein